MRELKNLEILTLKDCENIALLDKDQQSTKSDYISSNRLTYYIICNTWVMLWKEFTPHVWPRLASFIQNKGLIHTINVMQDEAKRVINEGQLGPWATLLYNDVKHRTSIIDRNLTDSMIGDDDDATVLFLLRYPKRFSPSQNDLTQMATLRDFKAYENRTKQLQRRTTLSYQWALPYVRSIISELYDWDAICSHIDHLSDDWYDSLQVSSGAAVDATTAYGRKIHQLYTDGSIDYARPIFGSYLVNRPAWSTDKNLPSKIKAVPKSYKSARIIAMEPVLHNAYGKAIEREFRRQDEYRRIITLESQERNNAFAYTGSITGEFATLDASHASDLISKTVLRDVFPHSYLKRIEWCLPSIIDIDGGRHALQMASTSGHTLTFRHETIVYYAIAEASCQIARSFGLSDRWLPVIVYGDDVVIPTYAYDIAIFLYKVFGLKINEDKSFSTGRFRESCGKDYMAGIDVTSIYYPRFPIVGSIDKNRIRLSSRTYNDDYRGKLENSTTMLIDLQKKLFPYCYTAARFIACIVLKAIPGMTTSIPGTVCGDLWDYADTGKSIAPRAFVVEKIGRYRTPRHQNYRFKYRTLARNLFSGDAQKRFDSMVALDTLHMYPVVTYESEGNIDNSLYIEYQDWKYHTFLKLGPQYSSPLDKLMGISTPMMSYSEYLGKRSLTMKLK